MSFRRGFKSQCERRSVEVRRQFGLRDTDQLLASQYAKQIGVVVWTERDITGLPCTDLEQLTQTEPDVWSAFTLRIEDRHLVVMNSTQSAPRQNSVLMHEVSHIALGHELTSGSLTDEGYFVPVTYDEDQEAEADWFAGALLLPRPSLLYIRRRGLSDEQAKSEFLVSQAMLDWRFRMTGVNYQMANSWRKRST